MSYYAAKKNFIHVDLVITAMKVAIKSNRKTVVVKVNQFSLQILKKLHKDGVINGFRHLGLLRGGQKNCNGFGNVDRLMDKYLVYLPQFISMRSLILSFLCFSSASRIMPASSEYLSARQFRKFVLKNSNYILLSTSFGLVSSNDLQRDLNTGGLVVLVGY